MVAGKPQKNVNSTTENVGKKKTKKQPERWLQQKKLNKKLHFLRVSSSRLWALTKVNGKSTIIFNNLFLCLHFSKEIQFFWIEPKNYTDLSSGDIEKRNTQKSVGVATRFSWNET